MPVSLAGGVWLGVTSQMRLMTTARWRSWSRAQDDLVGTGTRAFDTWEVGSGLEITSKPQDWGKLPLRLGVRYAQLPFSPSNARPSEWNFSVGTGAPFAANAYKDTTGAGVTVSAGKTIKAQILTDLSYRVFLP